LAGTAASAGDVDTGAEQMPGVGVMVATVIGDSIGAVTGDGFLCARGITDCATERDRYPGERALAVDMPWLPFISSVMPGDLNVALGR